MVFILNGLRRLRSVGFASSCQVISNVRLLKLASRTSRFLKMQLGYPVMTYEKTNWDLAVWRGSDLYEIGGSLRLFFVFDLNTNVSSIVLASSIDASLMEVVLVPDLPSKSFESKSTS